MQTHNFKIVGGDTDSIMFCKQDMSPFSEDEQESLLKEINSLLPKEIKFANDGVFKTVIYLKAKNYVMLDEKGKKKIKGSSLKSSTIEPILKQMMSEIIDCILNDNIQGVTLIYNKYLSMVDTITDITPWCSKKTLSSTTYNSERKNETDIIDAVAGSQYGSGDRVYLYTGRKTVETGEYYKVGEKKGLPKTKTVKYLKLKENFQNDHSIEHYKERVKKVAQIFEPVLGKDFYKNS